MENPQLTEYQQLTEKKLTKKTYHIDI